MRIDVRGASDGPEGADAAAARAGSAVDGDDGAVVAVLTAAGAGTRLGAGGPKALVEVGGRSLLRRAAQGLADSGVVDHLVVTAPGERVGQGPSRPEQAAGPQVDGVVPGGGDGVEQLAARGQGDAFRPGEVEDPVGHGGVGNSDHGSPAGMGGATSSWRRRHYSEVQIKSCQARPPTVTTS